MSSLPIRSYFGALQLGITLFCSMLLGQAATAPPVQPSLVEPTFLAVDPANNTASGQIRLTNLSATAITKISLTVGPFISKTSGLDIGAKATLGDADDAGVRHLAGNRRLPVSMEFQPILLHRPVLLVNRGASFQ